MRMYQYMTNIGIITMLTLSGYSFFLAGLVSSTVALAVFLISPRIAKLIDLRGQSPIVPKVALLPVLGTIGMLLCVAFRGPIWVMFPLALLMGSAPGPQALVRARWTYLIRAKRLGDQAPSIHGVFSYESILDDVSFMIAPPLSIFLASTVNPIAGMAFGITCFAVGVILLTRSRWSEPQPGWTVPDDDSEEEGLEAIAKDSKAEPDALLKGEDDPSSTRSIFRTSSVVRILFAMMFCMGAFFGSIDATSLSFAEEMGDPNIASLALMLQAFASVLMGFLFGMVSLPLRQSTQLIVTAVLFGCAFACVAFVDSVASFFIITVVASLFYAPFLITVNASCERAVPGSRFTEAITWVSAGCTCGMTLGPTVAGAIIDTWGTLITFKTGAVIVAMTAVIALVFRKTLQRGIR